VEGTLITKEENIVENPVVSGIALDKNEIRVGMYGVTDRPGVASAIFTALADANITVDMIVQTRGLDGTTDLDSTIPTTAVEICKTVMEQSKA
ncbi:ACT domain-containing protein, partial [Aliarcobacter butzleri]